MDSVESALNHCLPTFTVALPRAGESPDFVVTITAFPQCRGTGKSISEALSAARQQFMFLRDCRAAWAVEALLDEAAVRLVGAIDAPVAIESDPVLVAPRQ
jgi:hypothetical protein